MLENILDEYCCYVSDACGNSICHYQSGSISYVELTYPQNRVQVQQLLGGDRLACQTEVAVLIKGYVTAVEATGEPIETVPFGTIKTLRLPFFPEGKLEFNTTHYTCRIKRAAYSFGMPSEFFEMIIDLETCVCADAGECARKCFAFQTCIGVVLRIPVMRVDTYQYNAIAKEQQDIFTDEDELFEYGSNGIPSRQDVSLCKVFVNGFLQSPTNYDIQRGSLRFTTEDFPAKGSVVSVYSARLKCTRNAVTNYYVAVSDGTKTTFVNEDALTEYGGKGIPSPCEVSFVNLYVNGMLQPTPVYRMEKGLLELSSAPQTGQYVVLESVIIK